MFFNGPLIKKVADVDLNLISNVVDQIEKRYHNQWLSRSKLDIGSKVLKIIAQQPNVDLLDPDEQDALFLITEPLLKIIPMNEQDMICYADISNLPPLTNIKLHLDNIWLHVLSRRYHIPLKTSEKSVMGFLVARDKVEVEHMPSGAVYEINNTHPHAARNNGDNDRWHLIVDVIDKNTMKFIEHNWMDPVIAPSINWVWGDISYYHMYKAIDPNYVYTKPA
jgi:Aspartyl/Asparaginyl beta-hydroxylase